ncbi:uncharacterized protein JN550_002786 [Neoarthrinium moseri]|uniref:uncharacterized protein n=1 Tax=Neoarthrinium moseri TaxID=1658444 RepID=UPI001FDD7DB7|nr:uncharacterized protein JN550_002786 [Neoarthrinium moseri]KAI1874207.1 hypothetical protein JN550_002786 [Neoarthrinium moseri]
MATKNTIIVGAGVSGIAMAHTLKCKLGYTDFEIFEKHDAIGGTWHANTYPGCGSDVPIHLYSFSFNLNPDWTEELCDQTEILQYIENTVDKFGLRPHFRLNCFCVGATWRSEAQVWEVHFVNVNTKQRFTRTCAVLLTAVGGFSTPRDIRFPGMGKFKGRIFHTAEWDHSCDYRDKRVAVIGNGCSAAQVIPNIAKDVSKLTQFARGRQWYHPRPNHRFSPLERFCFRYIPFWQRYYRLKTFLDTDNLASSYGSSLHEIKQRKAIEENAKDYIYREAPEKYHSILVPDFPLGCKRRIFDPDYLSSLHLSHVDLIPEGIREFTETGIISETGYQEDFDIIILATGFQVSNFLTPLQIVGKTGTTIKDQWNHSRGAQAYMGTFVHNFPNFGILFGPNTFPAFNSVIYAVEVQVEYLSKTLFRCVLDGNSDVFEVKEQAEEEFVKSLDETLSQTVFNAGCNNWYINSSGRNSASWPGMASSFWKATFFPNWGDFRMEGGDRMWIWRRVLRTIKTMSSLSWVTLMCLATIAYQLNLEGNVLRK